MLYSADQIIGKTLIAAQNIELKRSAFDDSPTIYNVKPGQTVGVVDSYILPGPGRALLYWQFQDNKGSFYYAAHKAGMYSLTALTAQGTPTVVDQVRAEAKKDETTGDKIQKTVTLLALIAAGAYIVKNIVVK
jgi:hypothetical protein